jgi:hypothetical protein
MFINKHLEQPLHPAPLAHNQQQQLEVHLANLLNNQLLVLHLPQVNTQKEKEKENNRETILTVLTRRIWIN